MITTAALADALADAIAAHLAGITALAAVTVTRAWSPQTDLPPAATIFVLPESSDRPGQYSRALRETRHHLTAVLLSPLTAPTKQGWTEDQMAHAVESLAAAVDGLCILGCLVTSAAPDELCAPEALRTQRRLVGSLAVEVLQVEAAAVMGHDGLVPVASISSAQLQDGTVTLEKLDAGLAAKIDGETRLALTADETISAGLLVRMTSSSSCALAQPSSRLVLGIATTSASPGETVLVQTSGLFVSPSHTWTPGPAFLAPGGRLSATPDETYCQRVGDCPDEHSLQLAILSPIFCA